MGARLVGAYPIIAVDIVEHKLELARKMGATHVVNAKVSDAIQAVRDIIPGGAPYVFEVVGSEQVLAQAYRATCRGGTTVTIGLPHPEGQFAIPAASIVTEERTIKGSYMGSAIPRKDIPRLLNLYREGLLPVDALISRTLPLEEINSGLEALRKGEVVRQLVDMRKQG
jgi:alcohol dehydrogenase